VERRLKVFKNRLLRRIFDRVIMSRRMRSAGHVTFMGERIGVYRVLVGKLVVKKPLGSPKRRCEDNIKMDPPEVECGSMS